MTLETVAGMELVRLQIRVTGSALLSGSGGLVFAL
jgi:hypothetical protein